MILRDVRTHVCVFVCVCTYMRVLLEVVTFNFWRVVYVHVFASIHSVVSTFVSVCECLLVRVFVRVFVRVKT